MPFSCIPSVFDFSLRFQLIAVFDFAVLSARDSPQFVYPKMSLIWLYNVVFQNYILILQILPKSMCSKSEEHIYY